MNKPAALLPGDTIRLVAPSSPPKDNAVLEKAISAIESLGYRIKYANTIFQRIGYLAGSDQARAADFQEAFADSEAKAVFCVRGGYGSTRILGRIDWQVIKANRKIFMGFSDITALSCALWKECHLPSFSGPVATSDLIGDQPDAITWGHALSMVAGKCSSGNLIPDTFKNALPQMLVPGRAEGPLFGGNLSLICSLLGTPWFPELSGAILFIEDVAEPAYRVDRYLTQLLNAGGLDNLAGILIGDFRYSGRARKNDEAQGLQTMDDVFADRLGDLGIPVLGNLPFGHLKPKITIPFGVMASIDADLRQVTLQESGVV